MDKNNAKDMKVRIKDEVSGRVFIGTMDEYSEYIESQNKKLKENPYMIMQELAIIKKQNAQILDGINKLLEANGKRIEDERCAEFGRALNGVRSIDSYT